MTKQDTVEDFLAHHGIKGMKWGVRRTEAQLARASESVRKANELEPDKMYVSGKGRKTRVLSGEAARAAQLHSVATKNKSSKVLSNKDLEFLNKRLQMEKKYAELTYKKKMSAADKIQAVIKTYKNLEAVDRAMGSPARKAVVNYLAKKGGGATKSAANAASTAKKASSQSKKQKAPSFDDLFKKSGQKKPKQITADDVLDAVYNPKTGMYEVR